jgi:uncharacterized protein YqhQ
VLAGLASASRSAWRAARVSAVARRGVESTSRRWRRRGALIGFLVLAEVLAIALWQWPAPTASVGGAVVGGVAQLAALVAALFIARLTPYGRRVFTYHGAEHQTVRAHELGLGPGVDPGSVARLTSVHGRCGTHLACWLTVEAGALQVVRHGLLASGVVQAIVIVASLGVIAEVLRLASDRDTTWARLVRAPGSALQLLTTTRADAAHCEVALSALRELVAPASVDSGLGMAMACTSVSEPSLSS